MQHAITDSILRRHNGITDSADDTAAVAADAIDAAIDNPSDANIAAADHAVANIGAAVSSATDGAIAVPTRESTERASAVRAAAAKRIASDEPISARALSKRERKLARDRKRASAKPDAPAVPAHVNRKHAGSLFLSEILAKYGSRSATDCQLTIANSKNGGERYRVRLSLLRELYGRKPFDLDAVRATKYPTPAGSSERSFVLADKLCIGVMLGAGFLRVAKPDESNKPGACAVTAAGERFLDAS